MSGDTAGVASPTDWRQTDLAKRVLRRVEASAQTAENERRDQEALGQGRSWQPRWPRTRAPTERRLSGLERCAILVRRAAASQRR